MRDLDTLLNSLVNSENIVKGRGRQTAYDCPTLTHSNGGTPSRRLLAFLYRAAQGAFATAASAFRTRSRRSCSSRYSASSEPSKLVGALGFVR